MKWCNTFTLSTKKGHVSSFVKRWNDTTAGMWLFVSEVYDKQAKKYTGTLLVILLFSVLSFRSGMRVKVLTLFCPGFSKWKSFNVSI